jgi:hypothetical protein
MAPSPFDDGLWTAAGAKCALFFKQTKPSIASEYVHRFCIIPHLQTA